MFQFVLLFVLEIIYGRERDMVDLMVFLWDGADAFLEFLRHTITLLL